MEDNHLHTPPTRRTRRGLTSLFPWATASSTKRALVQTGQLWRHGSKPTLPGRRHSARGSGHHACLLQTLQKCHSTSAISRVPKIRRTKYIEVGTFLCPLRAQTEQPAPLHPPANPLQILKVRMLRLCNAHLGCVVHSATEIASLAGTPAQCSPCAHMCTPGEVSFHQTPTWNGGGSGLLAWRRPPH